MTMGVVRYFFIVALVRVVLVVKGLGFGFLVDKLLVLGAGRSLVFKDKAIAYYLRSDTPQNVIPLLFTGTNKRQIKSAIKKMDFINEWSHIKSDSLFCSWLSTGVAQGSKFVEKVVFLSNEKLANLLPVAVATCDGDVAKIFFEEVFLHAINDAGVTDSPALKKVRRMLKVGAELGLFDQAFGFRLKVREIELDSKSSKLDIDKYIKIKSGLKGPYISDMAPIRFGVIPVSGTIPEAVSKALDELYGVFCRYDGLLRNIDKAEYGRAARQLVREIELFHPDELEVHPQVFRLLLALMLSSGDFDNYYKMRCKLLDFYKDDGGVEARSLAEKQRFMNASLEVEDYKVFYERRNAWGGSAGYNYLTSIVRGSSYLEECQEFVLEDQAFYQYLKGKSVAIVGPADVGLDNGTEIDNFDVVVRFNFKGLDGFSKQRFGTKTNISYYVLSSQAVAESLGFLGRLDVVNRLDYVMASRNQYSEKLFASGRISVPKRFRFKAHEPENNSYFIGAPNAVQKAIIDLLMFEPACIKVFNANLWITKSHPGYIRREFRYSDLIYHDPVSNFLFMKNCWNNGLISCDDVLAEVLSLTVEGYLSKLQNYYGAE